MYITGLLLAWVLNVQDVQGWLHDKKAGYYDYPARIYGAVNVAIINGIDSKPLRLGAPHEPGPEFKQLETYLNSGGANIRNLPGCREKTMDLASVDVLFYLHPTLELDGHLQLHSKEWILRARQQLLPCVPPKFYSRTVLVIDGYALSVFGGEPFAVQGSNTAYESVYERILSDRYSLNAENIPSAQRVAPMAPLAARAHAAVKNKLYSFGGFDGSWLKLYHNVVIYDISNRYAEVIKVFPLPPGLPVGLQATATDKDRYIYVAGGQTEAGCSYSSRIVFRFDTETETFLRLPDLPYHVQSGQLVLMKSTNSLHYTGGSFNRSVDIFPYAPHFILKLPRDPSHANEWKSRKGTWHWREGHHLHHTTRLHHISVALTDESGQESLYVMGGVIRDAGIGPLKDAGSGELLHECIVPTGEPELRDSYKYTPHLDDHWKRISDLPIAVSHADASIITVANGRGILAFGGQTTLLGRRKTGKKMLTYTMAMSRHIVLFVPSLNMSRTVGYLPQWFRGEGVKDLVAVRERIPAGGNKTIEGGILLFGGEQSSKLHPPHPEPPFVTEGMARISLKLYTDDGEELDNIESI